MKPTMSRSSRSSRSPSKKSKRYSNLGLSTLVKVPVLQQVHETLSIPLLATALGSYSGFTPVSPGGSILAARLAGYQAFADEGRIDILSVQFLPFLGSNSSGRVCLYIERVPSEAVVATVDLAHDQREQIFGSLRAPPRPICWRPQEPTDRQFNLLNPGTVVLSKVCLLADSLIDGVTGVALPIGGFFGTLTIRVALTLRGRP